MAAADNIAQAINNYSMILVVVTQIVAAGQMATQEQVANIVALLPQNSVLTPKLDYSVDGKSYSWTAYQEMIGRQIEQLIKVQVLLAGPYEVRSVAY